MQQSAGGNVSSFDVEEAEVNEEALVSELMQQRGDTLNALINHRWVSLAVIAFVIAIVLENQTLLAMTAFMMFIVIFAWLWSRNSLVGVSYKRKFHHTHVFPNEDSTVEIIVENRKWLPVTWLQIEDTWPSAFPATNEKHMSQSGGDPTIGSLLNSYSLRWFERVRRHFDLRGVRRGLYDLGPTNLVSGDPFSLFERLYSKQERKQFLVVYPEVKSMDDLGLPLKDPFGDRRVQRRLFEDPNRIMGVRDYEPHDSFRTVHWKASAKTGSLQTKLFEPTRGTSIVLAVNVASFEQYWQGYWPAMLEYTLSVTGSIAKWAFENDYAVGLTCNGAVARSDQPFRLAPSRRYDQLQKILEMMASVRYYVTNEFGRHILLDSPRMPVGATFVLISPFISEMIGSSSIRLLRNGRRVSWVVLGKEDPPEVNKIITHHIPIKADVEDIEVPEDMILSTDDRTPMINPNNPDAPFEMPRAETPRQRYLRQKAEESAAHRRRTEEMMEQ